MKRKTILIALICAFTLSACNIVYDTPETLTETLVETVETTSEETIAETTAPTETTIASQTIPAISQTERQNSSNGGSSNNNSSNRNSSNNTPENAPAANAETTTAATTTAATTTAATTTASETATTTVSETTVTTTVTTTATTTAPETPSTEAETTKAIPPDGAVRNYEITLPTGEEGTYTGNIKNGLPEGKGTLKNPDAWVVEYTGDFVAGKFEGQGSISYNKDSHIVKYTGGFADGKYNGQGKIEYNEGSYYEGGFKDGQYSGKGTEYSYIPADHPDFKPGTYLTMTGNWKDGHPIGKGIIKSYFPDNTYGILYVEHADDGHQLGHEEEDGEVSQHSELYDSSGKLYYECDEIKKNNQIIRKENEIDYRTPPETQVENQ
jgi:hypothetical protein